MSPDNVPFTWPEVMSLLEELQIKITTEQARGILLAMGYCDTTVPPAAVLMLVTYMLLMGQKNMATWLAHVFIVENRANFLDLVEELSIKKPEFVEIVQVTILNGWFLQLRKSIPGSQKVMLGFRVDLRTGQPMAANLQPQEAITWTVHLNTVAEEILSIRRKYTAQASKPDQQGSHAEQTG